MCLALYASGVGEGAGTHVSIALTLLKGEHDKDYIILIIAELTTISIFLIVEEN